MPYPDHLFSNCDIQPNFFLCEKNGKKLFLFGSYHVLPFPVLPQEHQDMIGLAKTLLLETCEPSPSEKDLIQAGLISEAPLDNHPYEQLPALTREIIENASAQFCAHHKLAPIPLNRIKLDKALWLCRFAASLGGMEDTLKELFGQNAFGLEKMDSVAPLLESYSLNELNQAVSEGFGCLKNNPEYPEEILDPMKEYLSGEVLFNPYYTHAQEQDQKLVGERNQAWMPVILRHFNEKQDPILVAVGHAHLVGRTGLLCLLQKVGFNIFQYALDAKTFGVFMPNLLFENLAKNYRELSISQDVYKELSNRFEKPEICYPVMEYIEPTLIFSQIYPSKNLEQNTSNLPSPPIEADPEMTHAEPTSRPMSLHHDSTNGLSKLFG